MAMLSFCGVDVSKDRLDVVVLPGLQSFAAGNDAAGWAQPIARLRGFAISVSAAWRPTLVVGALSKERLLKRLTSFAFSFKLGPVLRRLWQFRSTPEFRGQPNAQCTPRV